MMAGLVGEMSPWDAPLVLSIVAAVIGIVATRGWHPRPPGEVAVDEIVGQP